MIKKGREEKKQQLRRPVNLLERAVARLNHSGRRVNVLTDTSLSVGNRLHVDSLPVLCSRSLGMDMCGGGLDRKEGMGFSEWDTLFLRVCRVYAMVCDE